MDERERRARDFTGDAISLADRLHERRLPRSQLSRQRDDEWRVRRAAEAMSPVAELRFAHRERAVIGEHGNERLVRTKSSRGVVAHRRPPDAESAATAGRGVLLAMRAFTSNS